MGTATACPGASIAATTTPRSIRGAPRPAATAATTTATASPTTAARDPRCSELVAELRAGGPVAEVAVQPVLAVGGPVGDARVEDDAQVGEVDAHADRRGPD